MEVAWETEILSKVRNFRMLTINKIYFDKCLRVRFQMRLKKIFLSLASLVTKKHILLI